MKSTRSVSHDHDRFRPALQPAAPVWFREPCEDSHHGDLHGRRTATAHVAGEMFCLLLVERNDEPAGDLNSLHVNTIGIVGSPSGWYRLSQLAPGQKLLVILARSNLPGNATQFLNAVIDSWVPVGGAVRARVVVPPTSNVHPPSLK